MIKILGMAGVMIFDKKIVPPRILSILNYVLIFLLMLNLGLKFLN